MPDTIIKMTGGVIRQQKNAILKDVNLEIKSGEFVYLIGKVGSGKSSLLKTLYAELPLEYGTAEIAGFQLKKIKKSQIPLLRRKCGIVFQDFKLLIDRDVYANLEFVLKATGWTNKKAIRERIETVLTKVEMLDKQHKMPHQLSGGEQQRIVLARALLNAPPIILADEPTGNIDPETSYRLIELLKEICDTGKTIIIATHQYDLIEKYPGRVLCCNNGELFEKCSPATQQAIVEETSSELPNELPEIVPPISQGEEPACLVNNEENTDTEEIPSSETTPESISEINEPEQELQAEACISADDNAETEKAGKTEDTEETGEEACEVRSEETEEAGIGEEKIEEDNKEEDIQQFIGKLSFPEVSAFDYEIGTMTEVNSFQEEEVKDFVSSPDAEMAEKTPAEEVPVQIKEDQPNKDMQQDVPSSTLEEKSPVKKEKRTKNTTPKPPVFDLELD